MDVFLGTLHDYFSFKNFRIIFNAVTPNEAQFARVEQIPNYVDRVSAPKKCLIISNNISFSEFQVNGWFFVLIAVEYAILQLKYKKKESHALNDTMTSVNMGMMSQMAK